VERKRNTITRFCTWNLVNPNPKKKTQTKNSCGLNVLGRGGRAKTQPLGSGIYDSCRNGGRGDRGTPIRGYLAEERETLG